MSFNPLIPQQTNPTLQSGKQIRANFQAINEAFSANHAPLTGNDEFLGKHTVLSMQPQNAAPVTMATQVALYNKLDSNSVPEIFFAPSSAQTPIQLTYPSISEGGISQQYTFIAGPFVIYSGFLGSINNLDVITLLPATTLLYVGIVPVNLGRNEQIIASASAISANTFTVLYAHSGGALLNMFYFAIGK